MTLKLWFLLWPSIRIIIWQLSLCFDDVCSANTRKEGFHGSWCSQRWRAHSWFTEGVLWGRYWKVDVCASLTPSLLCEAGSCSSPPKAQAILLHLAFSSGIENFGWNFPYCILGFVCLFLFPPLDCQLLKGKNHFWGLVGKSHLVSWVRSALKKALALEAEGK